MSFLEDFEHASNARTVGQRNFDALAARLAFPYTFSRANYLGQGEYVGGKLYCPVRVQITRIDLTAWSLGIGATVAVEIDGTPGDTITIPAGPGAVDNSSTHADLYLDAGEYLRIRCTSFAGTIDVAPSSIDVIVWLKPD